jgi:hypothetical protein
MATVSRALLGILRVTVWDEENQREIQQTVSVLARRIHSERITQEAFNRAGGVGLIAVGWNSIRAGL